MDPADGLAGRVRFGALLRRPFDPGWRSSSLPDDRARPAATGEATPTPPSPSDPDAPPYLPDAAARAPRPRRRSRRRCCAASTPPTTRCCGLAGAADTTVGAVDGRRRSCRARTCCRRCPTVRNAASPYGLTWLVARLRAPGGCPWDREQDHRSLRPFLLEEAYEVYDALEDGSGPELAEELGDLLLQIVLHAQYARRGRRLRPGGRPAGDHDQDRAPPPARVRGRRGAHGRRGDRATGSASRPTSAPRPAGTPAHGRGDAVDPDMPAAFAGLSRSLPALAYADEMQERAASLGYDWPDLEGVIDKIAEEATELLAAPTTARARARSTATCCSCSSTWAASWASTRRPRCAAPAASSRRASRASSGSRRTAAWSSGAGARCARRAVAGGQDARRRQDARDERRRTQEEGHA